MLWREHEIYEANESGVHLSVTLVRKSDGYTMILLATSQSPWTSCHFLVSNPSTGHHADGEVIIDCSDQHSLALELSEVLERMKVQLCARYSLPWSNCSVSTMMALLRRESEGIIAVR